MKQNSRTNIRIKTLAVLTAVTVGTALPPGTFAGITDSEQQALRDAESPAKEAQAAVWEQLIRHLPHLPSAPPFSRRMSPATPQYQAEFAKTVDSSGHRPFLLMKAGKKGEAATPAGKGYYDPATKKVFLRDAEKKVFVPVAEHPLIKKEKEQRKRKETAKKENQRQKE